MDQGQEGRKADSQMEVDGPQVSNPLLNPCVLEILLPYFGPTDLKTCRLVHPLWNSDATPLLKRKAMIYFDEHYDEEELPPTDLESQNYRDVRNYLRKMAHFQCESFCLSRGAKYTENSRELSQFFEQHGSGIKHLRIDFEYHSHFNVSLFRNILINYLPKLEHLDIRNIPVVQGRMTNHQELINVSNSIIGQRVPDGLPVFWPNEPYKRFLSIKRIDLWNYNAYVANLGRNFVQDLFEIAPNLECIQVVDRFLSNIVSYVVEGLRDNPAWAPNLKELLLDSYQSPTMQDIKTLSQFTRKLKVLRLGALPAMEDAADFQTLLNKQSGTLEELEFGNSVGEAAIRISLPTFPRLKSLELTQDVPKASKFNIIFDPVNYKETFPVLAELRNCRSQIFYRHDEACSIISRQSKYFGKHFFRGMGELWQNLFPRELEQVCTTLRILDIPYPKDPQSPFIRRLAALFPEVNNESLNAVRGTRIG